MTWKRSAMTSRKIEVSTSGLSDSDAKELTKRLNALEQLLEAVVFFSAGLSG